MTMTCFLPADGFRYCMALSYCRYPKYLSIVQPMSFRVVQVIEIKVYYVVAFFHL